MRVNDLVGARIVRTFVDRGGNLVLSLERECVGGVSPNLRLQIQHLSLRVKMDSAQDIDVVVEEQQD